MVFFLLLSLLYNNCSQMKNEVQGARFSAFIISFSCNFFLPFCGKREVSVSVFAFPNFFCVTFLGVGEARWLWRKTGRKSNKERRRRTTLERMINLFDLITKIWTMATFFIACTNLNVMKLTHYWKKIFHKLHQRQWYRKSESESWNNEKRMWGYFRSGRRGNEKHYQVKSENIIWNNFGRNDY